MTLNEKVFKFKVEVILKKGVLDPQGEAIENSLKNMSSISATEFKVGKKITFKIKAANKKKCSEIVIQLCEKLLVNEVIEKYTFKINDELYINGRRYYNYFKRLHESISFTFW